VLKLRRKRSLRIHMKKQAKRRQPNNPLNPNPAILSPTGPFLILPTNISSSSKAKALNSSVNLNQMALMLFGGKQSHPKICAYHGA
jgi:hypothetical protein